MSVIKRVSLILVVLLVVASCAAKNQWHDILVDPLPRWVDMSILYSEKMVELKDVTYDDIPLDAQQLLETANIIWMLVDIDRYLIYMKDDEGYLKVIIDKNFN